MLRISPFARVILGLVFGIATGIFFGEAAEDLSIVGELYIKLLQMTVLPYILVSMIGGLGRLDVALARSIGLRGGGMIGLLWLATLSMVVLIPLTYPSWETAAFFSSSANTAPVVLDPLTLYVPANPFYSLANTIVPAVVVFSLLLGTALISVPDKDGLLKALANLGDALMRIASLVAKTAPIGIFAISAAAAGRGASDPARAIATIASAQPRWRAIRRSFQLTRR